jgi:hypothetical protein
VIEYDAAREALDSIESELIAAHHSAMGKWEELLTETPHLALPLDATARANFIHPHLCREVEQRLPNMPGARSTDALGFYALIVRDEVLLRFKYLRQGHPSNYKTFQQKLLSRQTYTTDMVDVLELFRAPTLLTCGYTLEGAKVGRIEIRRDCKNHLTWSYDIYGGTDVAVPIVMDGLADDAKPATISSKRGVQIDEADAEIAEDE